MGPHCSSAETQVCHRSYIIAARNTCLRRTQTCGWVKSVKGIPILPSDNLISLDRYCNCNCNTCENMSGYTFGTMKYV